MRHAPADRFHDLKIYGLEEKAAELFHEMEARFLKYVDPTRDGKGEPVYGRGQLCMVGPDSTKRTAFNPPDPSKYAKKK